MAANRASGGQEMNETRTFGFACGPSGGFRCSTGSAKPPDQANAARSSPNLSGTTRYQTQTPRFSLATRPASNRILRWWLTVGCERPIGSTRSHPHTSPPSAEPISERSRSRAGSANAANAVARASAAVSSRGTSATEPQQTDGAVDFALAFFAIRTFRVSRPGSGSEMNNRWMIATRH